MPFQKGNQLRKGKKHSLETRKKLAGFKGRKHTEESKRKTSQTMTGQKRTQQTKDNISKALKDKPKSKEHKDNIAEANFKNGIGIYRREWERKYGKVPEGFVIHHIDRDRKNNNPNNLILMSRADHTKLHKNKKGIVKLKWW